MARWSAGVAMLGGSVLGGVVAQVTDLGVPFLLRVGVLVVMFVVAYALMHDLGFEPDRRASPLKAMRTVASASVEHGLKNPPVRYVMLAAPFVSGVGIYAFYALQPYLLELWGDPKAYSIAGLAAAIIAGAQVIGGWLAPRIRLLFRRRTTALILTVLVGHGACWSVLGVTNSFWVALVAAHALERDRGGRDADPSGVPQRHDSRRSSARRCCRSTR